MKDVIKWWWGAMKWLLRGRKILKQNWRFLITHGDTFSTLLSCLIAKKYHLKLIHIESGLRSYSILHPFPEELIRRIACRCADYLFAPGQWACNNLKYVRGKVINTHQNTVYDLLRQIPIHKQQDKYVVFTCHRQETIYNARRLMKVVELAHRIAQQFKVKYILHASSKHQLQEYNYYKGLVYNDNIELLPYQDYVSFMSMVAGAVFVVTDGGGLQEETYALDVPCLLMRNRTERHDGLNETAYLSRFEPKRIDYFLEHYKTFHRKDKFKHHQPSKIIVDYLEKLCG